MPELPDIEAYLVALEPRVLGQTLEKIRLPSIALLRTVEPPLRDFEGLPVRELRRLGKRVVFGFDEELFLVFHLMVAGRFQWKKRGVAIPKKRAHGALDFPKGSLLLTEAGTKKRSTLHAIRGEGALAGLDPGGMEVIGCALEDFRAALLRENHTLKRTLTDPHLFSGIGGAYADEILHKARLSPVKWSQRLSDAEVEQLFEATQEVLVLWRDRLCDEAREAWPEKVTAFRPEMAVHGRFREPCPECGAPVQRIVYASNETNYCAPCQTEGRLLADRALSQLLKKDWPRTLEEMEQRRPARSA
ncbi:MAG: DNA-formamidopyrimidine glycosylase family protein [Myxococcota bacterium]|nr:DNA-formamidopyrimidine glycosylase family protein [Myxococcota bacterium]